MQSRRAFLPALFATAAVPGAAHALRFEAANPEVAAAYEGACGAASLHGELQRALRDRAEGGPLPSEFLRFSRCPACGCGIDLERDLPEPRPGPNG